MRITTMLMCVVLTAAIGSVARAQDVEQTISSREITSLRDELYQVRDGQQYTVFLVTPEGIVLADPLRRETALWLKGELDVRFPQRPVRLVLLSHHHVERAEGASVFADTAEVIGNRAFDSELTASRRLAPDVYRFVNYVDTTFDSRRTITFGGRTVELVSTEGLHTEDMTVLNFPAERLAFAVDPPQITTVPFSFGPNRPRDVFNWIHIVTSLDFETLLTGSGERIARSQLIALRAYLDSVRKGVVAAVEQGETAAQLQASPFLNAHAGNPHYAGRDIHVGVVYRTLRLTRAEVSASFIAQYEGRNPGTYCGSYAFCSAGGAVSGGNASAAVLFGSRFGAVLELTAGNQSWSSRRRASFYEEVAIRKTRGALLFRYTPHQRLGTLSYALLGGISYTIGDVRGMNYVPGVVVPVGGFHAIAEQNGRTGATVGVDLRQSLGRRLAVVMPMRATQLVGRSPGHWAGLEDLQIGVGVAMQVMRRVD